MSQVIGSGRLIPWSEAVDFVDAEYFLLKRVQEDVRSGFYSSSLHPPPRPHSSGRSSYVEVFTQLSLDPTLSRRE